MASAARSIVAHRPQVLVTDGQGALIALEMSKPLVLEAALSLRIDPLPVVHGVAFESDAWVASAAHSARDGWERIPEPGPLTYIAVVDWLWARLGAPLAAAGSADHYRVEHLPRRVRRAHVRS